MSNSDTCYQTLEFRIWGINLISFPISCHWPVSSMRIAITMCCCSARTSDSLANTWYHVQKGTGSFMWLIRSVAQSWPTLCRPMNCSTPGRPVHHQLISIMSIVKLISIESVMPSSHLILCRPLLLLPHSLPALEYFPKRQLFAWGVQSTGVSALASFLPKKSQGWSPSEWTDWISLQFKWLPRVFSNTMVQKHQFFGAQPSLRSNSHIHTWLLEKPLLWLDRPLLAK